MGDWPTARPLPTVDCTTQVTTRKLNCVATGTGISLYRHCVRDNLTLKITVHANYINTGLGS
jgi:hypothetical protein